MRTDCKYFKSEREQLDGSAQIQFAEMKQIKKELKAKANVSENQFNSIKDWNKSLDKLFKNASKNLNLSMFEQV